VKKLSQQRFYNLVQTGPLVGLDLLLCNSHNEVLLGLRKHAPAKGCWFVPGGRLFKDETIQDGVRRIVASEIPWRKISPPQFYGVYEHFYDHTFCSARGTTHYVVLAFFCKIKATTVPALRLNPHHHILRWWPISAARKNRLVHPNTKAYLANLKRSPVIP